MVAALLQAIRVVVFAVCYPFLKYTGYGITMRKAAVCVWAGLRGAVGLALSMFLLFDGEVSDRSFRLLAFFFTGMIAAITILVQGATTGLLLEVTPCACLFKVEYTCLGRLTVSQGDMARCLEPCMPGPCMPGTVHALFQGWACPSLLICFEYKT